MVFVSWAETPKSAESKRELKKNFKIKIFHNHQKKEGKNLPNLTVPWSVKSKFPPLMSR